MRPVIRPDGAYHTSSMQATARAGGMGGNTRNRVPNATVCLALSISEELNRLEAILLAAAATVRPIVNTVLNAILSVVNAAALLPVTVPGLVIVPAPGAPPITYDAALHGLNATEKRFVENIIHYRIIQRNLQYDIANNTFVKRPILIIADIPFAISAMQDAREQVRLAGVGAKLYVDITGVVKVGVPAGVPAGAPAVSFVEDSINTHINGLYASWENQANKNPMPYSNAGPELVNNLGPYCVYCEANLKTQIDVEHMLPKGKGDPAGRIRQGFSSFAKSWLNFLPSCPRCNSTKSDYPSKLDITNAAVAFAAVATAAGLAPAHFQKDDGTDIGVLVHSMAGGDARITDLEYHRLFTDYYQFPLDPASFQNVGYSLWNLTASIAEATTIPGQIYWTISSINEVDKSVQVTQPGVPGTTSYQVFIDDGLAGIGILPSALGARSKVSNMVNICGLNATHANTDRRVLERTEAWFMALAAVRRMQIDLVALQTAFPGGEPLPNFYLGIYALWRDTVILTIKEKGFFSIWLKIFNQFPHPLGGNAPQFPANGPYVNGGVAGAPMNLAQDIATQLRDRGYFPNTNFTQVP